MPRNKLVEAYKDVMNMPVTSGSAAHDLTRIGTRKMAEAADQKPPSPELGGGAVAMMENPWLRQIAVMVGIAASVALGVAVGAVVAGANYAPLYGQSRGKDASQVMEALQQVGVDYRVDQASGMVVVPAAKVGNCIMQLAGQGPPNSVGMGFELLQ